MSETLITIVNEDVIETVLTITDETVITITDPDQGAVIEVFDAVALGGAAGFPIKTFVLRIQNDGDASFTISGLSDSVSLLVFYGMQVLVEYTEEGAVPEGNFYKRSGNTLTVGVSTMEGAEITIMSSGTLTYLT